MAQFNPLDYGPLAFLAGVWEGTSGDDIAPSDDRGTENNKYREKLILEPIGAVNNHEQKLFGLRYSTMAWRMGEQDPFHEENGYWLWDGDQKQVMRCFIVPRGVSVIAGGQAEPDATEFTMVADLGSPTFGICSNPFLDKEFKTVRYELKVIIHDETSFSYEEDTQIMIKGQPKVFHHTDKHNLKRVSFPG